MISAKVLAIIHNPDAVCQATKVENGFKDV